MYGNSFRICKTPENSTEYVQDGWGRFTSLYLMDRYYHTIMESMECTITAKQTLITFLV